MVNRRKSSIVSARNNHESRYILCGFPNRAKQRGGKIDQDVDEEVLRHNRKTDYLGCIFDV